MLRLASHLIAQRSFFPLFPPPLGACLDLTVAPRALDLPVLPHLLLLPSDLVPFAKVRGRGRGEEGRGDTGRRVCLVYGEVERMSLRPVIYGDILQHLAEVGLEKIVSPQMLLPPSYLMLMVLSTWH